MKTFILSPRGWRITAIVFGVVVALLLAVYAALMWAFPPQRLSALLAEQVKSKTGRDFRIGGGLSIRLLPRIAVVAEDVAIGNAEWGSRPDMVTLQRAAFEVSLRPLLHGVVHVLSVDVQGADVLLESDARGRANWMFAPQGASPAAPAASAASAAGDATVGFDLDRVTVADARITYRDAVDEKPLVVSIESLVAGNQGDRIVVTAAFSEGQQRWRLEGETGRLAAWTSAVADWPFDLRLSSDGAKLSAVGSLPGAGRSGATRAAVKAHFDKAGALVPWVGDAAAQIVPFDAEATLQHDPDVFKADALRLSIAGQAVTGQVTVRTERKLLRVEATLAASSIDLSHWVRGPSQPAQPAGPAQPRAPLFSDTPLPPVVLPKFSVQANVRIERLVIPGMPPLAKLAAQIKSEPDHLVVEPLSFAVADGDVRGRLELTARGREPLRVAVRLNANALSLQALDVPALGGPRFRGGRANAQVNLNLAGHTPHALAASSDGRALVSVSDVTLSGAAAAMQRNVLVTLLDALLPKRDANQPTTISCAVFNLPLRNGVARIDRTVAFETSQLAVAASGELNLAAQTVALGFQPTAKKGLGINPASLAQLVSLRGPLQDPGVGIDVQGTTREAARIGAAVATGGLTLIGSRMLAKSEDTEVCRHAAASSSASSPAAPGKGR